MLKKSTKCLDGSNDISFFAIVLCDGFNCFGKCLLFCSLRSPTFSDVDIITLSQRVCCAAIALDMVPSLKNK